MKKINQGEKKFTVLLNGQNDLENQLEKFKGECAAYNELHRRNNKKRYYNLALMAKVDKNTTYEDVKRLLRNNTKTFLIDILTHKTQEIESLVELIRQARNEEQAEQPNIQLTIGLALQIAGDACRIGRIRNNCPLFLARGDTMTLTTNPAYRFASVKEIAFVTNLQYYLPYIKLNDEILIGNEVRGCVIKKLKTALAIRIEEYGIVSSYDLLELPSNCYHIELPALCDVFCNDLEMAAKLQMDFVALPHIHYLPYLKLLRATVKTNYKFKLIGNIDLEYISRKMVDVVSIIKNLDYIWLTHLFVRNQTLNVALIQAVISVAKCMKKPIIGSLRLERCNDFKRFESHEYLWKIDCIFIEKSSRCHKYPLTVRKLLPIQNYRLAAAVENTAAAHDSLTNCHSIVNFIIRTISSIQCQAIFLHTNCETAAKSLSRVEIYCPVYVMFPLIEPAEDTMEEHNSLLQFTKNLNLLRNLKPIPYTKAMNELDYKPIDYGIEYACQCGSLEPGDFIITLEIGKENGDEHVQLGVDEDVVLMRAFYIPPKSAD